MIHDDDEEDKDEGTRQQEGEHQQNGHCGHDDDDEEDEVNFKDFEHEYVVFHFRKNKEQMLLTCGRTGQIAPIPEPAFNVELMD